MYPSHWGLSHSPFGPQLDPRHFFESAGHEEALARLHFLVEEHRRLGLLVGPSGCGKSLLLEIFAERMRAWGRPVAKVSLMAVEPVDLLVAIADELHVPLSPDSPSWRIWQQLDRRLRQFRYDQLETVLLLDDADQATPEVLTQVARLAKHDLAPESRLTLVVSSQTNGAGRLGESLLDLAELRIDVPPWQPSDTAAYVQRSLERVGGSLWLFAQEAIERMHDLSEGSPRRVRQLADLALLAAAGSSLEHVDADTVEAASDQLAVRS